MPELIRRYEIMPTGQRPMWKPEDPPAGAVCAASDVEELERVAEAMANAIQDIGTITAFRDDLWHSLHSYNALKARAAKEGE